MELTAITHIVKAIRLIASQVSMLHAEMRSASCKHECNTTMLASETARNAVALIARDDQNLCGLFSSIKSHAASIGHVQSKNNTQVKRLFLVVHNRVSLLERATARLLTIHKEIRVKKTTSVLRAMKFVASENPELVICDHTLPKETGLAFLKHLREEGFNTPFILCREQNAKTDDSNNDDSEDIDRGTGSAYRLDYKPDLDQDRFLEQLVLLVGEILDIGDDCSAVGSETTNRRISGETIAQLIETASDAILWADGRTGIVLHCNKAAEELFTKTRSDIIGTQQEGLFSQNTHNEARAILDLEGITEHSAFQERYVSLKNGRTVPVEVATTALEIDGQLVVQSILRDVSARRALAELKYKQKRTELFFGELAALLLSTDEPDAAIDAAVGDVGEACGTCRSFVSILDKTTNTVSRKHEWCAPGVQCTKKEMQNVPLTSMPWRSRLFDSGAIVNVPNTEAVILEDQRNARMLETQNVKAVLIVPLRSGSRTVGCFGFHNTKKPRKWKKSTIRMVRVAAELIGSCLARKNIANELENVVSQLQSTFNATADGILIVNSKGIVTGSNKRLDEMWGLPPEVLESVDNAERLQHVVEKIEHVPSFLAKIEELRKAPEKDSFNIVHLKDGRIFERNSRPQRIQEKIVGRVWSFHDVTEQFNARRKLAASLALLRSTLESTANALIVIGSDKTILDYNEKFQQLWDIPFESLHNGTFDTTFEYLLNSVEKSNEFRRVLDGFRRDSHVEIFDVLQLKDGRTIKMHTQPHFLHGQIAGRAWSFRDITERVTREDKLRRQQEDTAFLLDIVSHDLKNFVTATTGYLDLILTIIRSKQATRYARKAKASNTSMHALLKNLTILMKNQIHAPKELYPVSISAAIAQVSYSIPVLFVDKNVEMDSSLVPEGISVWADALFPQLLQNLLVNTVKSTPRSQEVAKIQFSIKLADEKTDRIILMISDNGHGVAPEERKHLFERYNVLKAKGAGSGLGLFIVKTLVERYGGEIRMKSRVEQDFRQGTVFEIELKSVKSHPENN